MSAKWTLLCLSVALCLASLLATTDAKRKSKGEVEVILPERNRNGVADVLGNLRNSFKVDDDDDDLERREKKALMRRKRKRRRRRQRMMMMALRGKNGGEDSIRKRRRSKSGSRGNR